MGQAKQKKSRLERMQVEQPWCIYCGGKTLGTSADHMPPITICDDRLRPAGMEFLACSECHEGTRSLDQVAGLFCRAYPNSSSPTAQQQMRKIFRGIANNHPEIFRELRPSWRQLEFAQSARGTLEGGGGALNVGPKTHEMMLRFGARAALALHYHISGEIVPGEGGVFVRWHTNESLITGDFPADFAEMLPQHQTLRAGRNHLEGQFDFASNITDDKRISVHMLTFRLSFAVQAFVTRDIVDFDRAKEYPQLIFRPGFLKRQGPVSN